MLRLVSLLFPWLQALPLICLRQVTTGMLLQENRTWTTRAADSVLSMLAFLRISPVLVYFRPSEKFPLTSGFVSRETVANVDTVIIISVDVEAVNWRGVVWRS